MYPKFWLNLSQARRDSPWTNCWCWRQIHPTWPPPRTHPIPARIMEQQNQIIIYTMIPRIQNWKWWKYTRIQSLVATRQECITLVVKKSPNDHGLGKQWILFPRYCESVRSNKLCLQQIRSLGERESQVPRIVPAGIRCVPSHTRQHFPRQCQLNRASRSTARRFVTGRAKPQQRDVSRSQ